MIASALLLSSIVFAQVPKRAQCPGDVSTPAAQMTELEAVCELIPLVRVRWAAKRREDLGQISAVASAATKDVRDIVSDTASGGIENAVTGVHMANTNAQRLDVLDEQLRAHPAFARFLELRELTEWQLAMYALDREVRRLWRWGEGKRNRAEAKRLRAAGRENRK